MQIDLKASIEKTNGRITQKFLGQTLGRPKQTIYNWVKNNIIPRDANIRLIGIFRENGVEPEFVGPTIK
jgi:DNA-binding transcriptional regulator YiaG